MNKKKNWKRCIALLCAATIVFTMFAGVDFGQVEASTVEKDKQVITSCDSTDGVTLVKSGMECTSDATYVTEGTGAFLYQGTAQVVFEIALTDSVDISKYGAIHFSLYIDKISNWNGLVRFSVSSAANPDQYCIKWNLDKSTFVDGWNEVSLSLSDYTAVSSTGVFDSSQLNYLKIWQGSGNATGNLSVSVDDIYAHTQTVAKKYTSGTITGGVAPSEANYDADKYVFGGWFKNYDASAEEDEQFTNPLTKGEQVTASATNPVYARLVPADVLTTKAQCLRNETNPELTLASCDDTEHIKSTDGTINTYKSYVKEGTGSLHATDTDLQFVLTDAVDITDYQYGSLHFWLYIEDVSQITNLFRVYLSSGGTYNSQYISWYMTGNRLHDGWNELYLPLADSRSDGTDGGFNPAGVNCLRIWGFGDSSQIYLDDVSVVDAVYLMTAHSTTELYGSSNIGTSLTSEYGEYVCGTGAYANYDSSAQVRHAAQVRLLGHTNQTAYQIAKEYQTNGALHFWLNICDIDAWNGNMIVQLSSDATGVDTNNLQWTVDKEHLKEGWNECYLNLSQATQSGTIDYDNINFFRVMMAGDSDTGFDTMLDDVRIVANDVETVDVRFVSTVNSVQYAEVKIKIEKSGSSSVVCEPSKVVYSRLYEVGSDEVVSEVLPSVFHSDSRYFFTQTITGMPIRVFDSIFTATPYWITLDGTEVQGTSRTYTLNQAISTIGKETKELVDPRGKTLEDTSTGETNPQLAETLYETTDVVVADIIPTEMGYAVDSTGKTDSTEGIQKALYDCHDEGGGTVYLPAGNYAISHSIYIPPYVTLRGDWQDPDVGTEYGTIISVWMDADDSERTGIFRMGSCGGAVGLTVYYPLQSLETVVPYPYTFFVGGAGADHTLITISDITIINGYRGIGTEYYTSHECLQVDNVKGTYLLNGYKGLYSTDVDNITNFKVSNTYWKEAAAACMESVSSDAIDAYTKQYTTGIQLGDLDWTQLSNISISGCAIGIHGVTSGRSAASVDYSGGITDLNITDCVQGLVFDKLDVHWGVVIARGYIEGDIVNNTTALIKLCDVEVQGDILEQTSGTVVQDDTDLSDYAIDYDASYVKPSSRLKVLDLPKGTYEDAAPKVQEALDAMAEEGGGVVYIPGGVYSFQTSITVPTGVELRGATSVATREIAYDFAGTLFLCYYGDDASNDADDTAFITLNGKNAGLNGIRIVYPENSPKSDDMKTTYTVRGNGTGVYVVNSMISGSYYGIDFSGCDEHFVYGVTTCCYYNGFLLGGENGIMSRCLQNGTVLVRVNTPYVIDGVQEDGLFTELIDPVLKETTDWIIVKDATNQLVYNAFVYGPNTGIVNINSKNTILNNFGTDDLTDSMIEMQSGSLTSINTMRLDGTSYTKTGGTLAMYNSFVYGEANVTASGTNRVEGAADVNAETYHFVHKDLGDSEDEGVSLLACDEESEFESLKNGWFTRISGEYVQGTGALAIGSLSKYASVQGTFATVDISEYEQGSLHISLYADKPEKLGTAVYLEISSSGSYDDAELSWIIPALALESGWNDIYLSIANAIKTGEIDLTSVNYFRLRAPEIQIGANLIMDDVYATTTEASSLTAVREATTASTKQGYLMDCDTLEGLRTNGSCILSVNEAGGHEEGDASIAMTRFEYIMMKLQDADVSDYPYGSLSFRLYVNDKEYIEDDTLYVELSSGGTYDVQELSWSISGTDLNSGWNHISLSLPEAKTTGGQIDLTSVNFLRIRKDTINTSLLLFLDAVCMEDMPTRVADNGQIASCDALTDVTVSGSGTFSATTTCTEGEGALQGVFTTAVAMRINMHEYVNISDYSEETFKFWIHVDNPTNLGDDLRVELSSGADDELEHQWKVSKDSLITGWNEVILNFADASKSADGGVDFEQICRFRIYNTIAGSEAVTLIVDDIRAGE